MCIFSLSNYNCRCSFSFFRSLHLLFFCLSQIPMSYLHIRVVFGPILLNVICKLLNLVRLEFNLIFEDISELFNLIIFIFNDLVEVNNLHSLLQPCLSSWDLITNSNSFRFRDVIPVLQHISQFLNLLFWFFFISVPSFTLTSFLFHVKLLVFLKPNLFSCFYYLWSTTFFNSLKNGLWRLLAFPFRWNFLLGF